MVRYTWDAIWDWALTTAWTAWSAEVALFEIIKKKNSYQISILSTIKEFFCTLQRENEQQMRPVKLIR